MRLVSESSNIYSETVRFLRDVSRNHAAAAADMCRGDIPELSDEAATAAPPLPARVPPSREVDDLGAMLRELEDVGLAAVCRLARVHDDRAAYRAIEDADAGWLRGVILNRAVETVGQSH
jgi:hypothetical protein